MLLGVDVGGTFTDAVLVDGESVHTAKAASTPADQSDGVMAAIDAVLERAGAQPADVTAFAHGMTVATNALLEGHGAPTALVATEGFTDVVELGRQARRELYRLQAAHPPALVPPERRVAAPERVGAHGEVLRALEDPSAVAAQVAALGVDAVAVCLLHADRFAAHERALGAALRAAGIGHVSLSHEVVGTFREHERAATTEVDAALSPLLAAYLARLTERAAEAGLPAPEIMQSSGGLTDAPTAAAHAAFTVLSGPAGGAAAAALVARAAGEPDLLCFDMGGTSCDVCVVEDGRVRETAGREVGGRPLALGMVDIHTVGAGGGSVAWRDGGGALRVGPRSSGAEPGPAAYGRGGTEPTVTDAHVVLGHLTGGLAGGVRLDAAAAERAVAGLADTLGLGTEETARGILRVADAEMVRALRVMTVERGLDPRELALLAFGGAGPLHAVAIAEELGVERVLIPQAGSVLSALGLAAADRRRDEAQTVLRPGAELSTEELGTLAGDADAVAWEVRYRGQAHELVLRELAAPTPERMAAALAGLHEERYGYADRDAAWELVTVRRTWRTPGADVLKAAGEHDGSISGPTRWSPEAADFTAVVPEGWSGGLDATGTLRLARDGAQAPDDAADAQAGVDPIALQVATGALRAACEEMGATLIRAAHSANIKERRDCSTALFDPAGEMVMQAEHIPVHLGSMPAAVAAVRDERHAPGVAWVLNDPFAGGTHLPDVTVITPAFDADGTLLGFAAARAHHADVGGRVPGSMPADSTTLEEEGVVIAPRVLDDAAIEELVARMRQPDQRRADLRAQLAANRVGVTRLRELAERLGTPGLQAATAAVLDYAERRTRACLAEMEDGERRAEDVLEGPEGDIPLRLRATIAGDEVTLDLTGSAPQDPGNLNCPEAVTVSACVFALKVLTDPDIPPSAGAHRPVRVLVPPGTLLNADRPAAVAAGNVETSSRVADLVMRAFGLALGQGTMNNLTLGSEDFTYYETLGGGQAASALAPGPSGVHVAMSNTRNTPVEALELELPLRVVRYERRRGSGGAGARPGGDGVVRELEALADMTYSLIAERRRHAPPGADGGRDGAPGRDTVDGDPVPPKSTGPLRAGQRLRIETPGGGGFGTP